MDRPDHRPAAHLLSVHDKRRSGQKPRRKWRPEIERDRSMRAYMLNPRAVRMMQEADDAA